MAGTGLAATRQEEDTRKERPACRKAEKKAQANGPISLGWTMKREGTRAHGYHWPINGRRERSTCETEENTEVRHEVRSSFVSFLFCNFSFRLLFLFFARKERGRAENAKKVMNAGSWKVQRIPIVDRAGAIGTQVRVAGIQTGAQKHAARHGAWRYDTTTTYRLHVRYFWAGILCAGPPTIRRTMYTMCAFQWHQSAQSFQSKNKSSCAPCKQTWYLTTAQFSAIIAPPKE